MKVQQGKTFKFNFALLAGAFLLSTVTAYAGSVLDVSVTIDDVEKRAHGNMKTARYSDNTVEMIGCGTRTIAATDTSRSWTWGFCRATSSDGVHAYCNAFDDKDVIEQIRAAASYSYIIFNWDENGNCTYVGNSTQSMYLPENN